MASAVTKNNQFEDVPPAAVVSSDNASSSGDSHDNEGNAEGFEGDKSIAKGGVTTPFPYKLHEMLDSKTVDKSIVCWQPHGRAFMVHKPKEFVTQVMPHYFNQTKYASFQRQLNLYGFSRLSHGRDKGAYYHMCFVRGERLLCRGMIRQKIKGTKVRRSLAPEEEPNFYAPEWQRPTPKLTKKPTYPPNGNKRSQKTPKDTKRSSLVSLVIESKRSTPSVKSPLPPPPHVLVQSPPQLVAAQQVPSSAIPTAPIMNVPSSAPPAASAMAKGGDLLYFEGRPFRYLEHLEELPPRPQVVAKRVFDDTYKDSLRDMINSIVNLEPDRMMSQNSCSV